MRVRRTSVRAVVVQLRQVAAFQQQPSAVRDVKARDQVQQRRLADAGLADDGDVFTGHHGERHAVEHAPAGRAAEGLGDIAEFEHVR